MKAEEQRSRNNNDENTSLKNLWNKEEIKLMYKNLYFRNVR